MKQKRPYATMWHMINCNVNLKNCFFGKNKINQDTVILLEASALYETNNAESPIGSLSTKKIFHLQIVRYKKISRLNNFSEKVFNLKNLNIRNVLDIFINEDFLQKLVRFPVLKS